MKRISTMTPMLALCAMATISLAACGGSSTTTTVTSTAPAPTTTSAPTTSTTTPKPQTTSSTGTSTGAVVPGNCTNGQVYDSVAKTCVTPNPSGNPCPQGEVPMADRPVCVRQSSRD
jgi:hypothetical protein